MEFIGPQIWIGTEAASHVFQDLYDIGFKRSLLLWMRGSPLMIWKFRRSKIDGTLLSIVWKEVWEWGPEDTKSGKDNGVFFSRLKPGEKKNMKRQLGAAAAAKEKPRKRVESLRLSVASLTYSRFFWGSSITRKLIIKRTFEGRRTKITKDEEELKCLWEANSSDFWKINAFMQKQTSKLN